MDSGKNERQDSPSLLLQQRGGGGPHRGPGTYRKRRKRRTNPNEMIPLSQRGGSWVFPWRRVWGHSKTDRDPVVDEVLGYTE